MKTEASHNEESARYNPAPATAREAIGQLVWANRILANEAIFDHLGHVSVRNPENPATFFIARNVAPDSVNAGDILEVDQDGTVLTQGKGKPYSERLIHGAIYSARGDVNSVVHAHPVPVVTMSVSEVPFRIVAHPAVIFYDGVPLYDGYDFTSAEATGMLVQTKKEAARVTETLGGRMAMLMRGHGCNVVGRSVPHAVQAAISFRDNVVIQLGAQQFGKVKELTYEQAKASARVFVNQAERGWNSWVNHVRRTMPEMR